MSTPTRESPFAALERRSLVDGGIDQIKSLVANGVLEPGKRLPSERALAQQFGISRPALREAVRALVAMGVLTSRPGSGTYVTDLSADVLAGPLAFVLEANRSALVDLFQVRFLLETGAVESAARNVTEDDVTALQEALEVMRDALGTVERFVDADISFHRVVHRAAGNVLLLELMSNIAALDRRLRLLTSHDRAVRKATLAEHAKILAALEARSPVKAVEAMREHLTSCWIDLVGEGWQQPLVTLQGLSPQTGTE